LYRGTPRNLTAELAFHRALSHVHKWIRCATKDSSYRHEEVEHS
jgi:hypothetical protein